MKLNKLPAQLPRLNQQRLPLINVGDGTSWRTGLTSSTARGYGYDWQKIRLAFLKQHPLCVYCLKEGKVTAATVVDHIVPHRGNEALRIDEQNLQALCSHHHSSVKQKEERAQGDLGRLSPMGGLKS